MENKDSDKPRTDTPKTEMSAAMIERLHEKAEVEAYWMRSKIRNYEILKGEREPY
jgi:hypothetical protein